MTFDVPILVSAITGPSTLNLSGRTGRTCDEIDRIIAAVICEFGVERADLFGPRKPEIVAWPRQIAMAIAYDTGAFSLAYVGERFGGRDHGTVLHAVRRMNERCETDKRSREQVERVKQLLTS